MNMVAMEYSIQLHENIERLNFWKLNKDIFFLFISFLNSFSLLKINIQRAITTLFGELLLIA